MPAVFGDFLAAANTHLAAALSTGSDDASTSATMQDLRRLVAVLSRYCDDLTPCDEVAAASRNDLHPWERTAIGAGSALRMAVVCLRRATNGADGGQTGAGTPDRERHLAATARELAAGRDLLHTHLSITPDGRVRGRTDWAPVVTSVPVTRALASEIVSWSLLLAPFTAQLAYSAAGPAPSDKPGQPNLGRAHAELASASQWLQAVGAAARPAFDADPVRAADAELLSSIPSATVPPRQRPGPAGESVAELCRGITISASRLRWAMRDSEDRARWSPGVTSGAWQWMAQAAVITSHLSELALRAVATRAGHLASLPVTDDQFNRAVDLMADMRAAWSQVDQAWNTLITETRLLTTPAMTEASDLLLRTGRLVWDDPQWTPARSRRAPRRTPAELAPGPATLSSVVAAVHHSVDALTHVAEAETNAVKAAGRAGRLYVPTRSLPDGYDDVPRPYAPAPAFRYLDLLEVYQAANHASTQAALALDGLAITSGVGSRLLALARAAASAQSNRSLSQNSPDNDASADPSPAGALFGNSRASTGIAGPVERAVRNRRVADPGTLLRAVTIDNAAHQLITYAGDAVSASNVSSAPKNRHADSSAAQLAAQSFPGKLSERPSTGQPSRSADQVKGPANSAVARPRPRRGRA